MSAIEISSVFLIGGSLYGAIEILCRRYTHWTMVITGGLCFMMIYYLSTRLMWPFLFSCLVGAIIITAMEFIVGYIVNIKFNWNVWDYSQKRFNLLGQICPMNTCLWFFLCIPAVGLARLISPLF